MYTIERGLFVSECVPFIPLKDWFIVTTCPWISGLIFSVGAFTVAYFLLKTLLVLAQTFVFPGQNVHLCAEHVNTRLTRAFLAQKVWRNKGCLGRFVMLLNRPSFT